MVALIATTRRRPWARLPLLLAAWPGTIVLALAGPLAASWLLNLNSAYIVFFVPVALLLAIVASRGCRALSGHRVLRPSLSALAGFLLTLALLFGARQQMSLINPETVLARPADVAALAWVERELPEEARVAVNAWKWLGITWAGSDGGAWLLPLTGRAGTTPPVDYIYNPALAREVDAFNRAAQEIADWSGPAAAAWLQAQGVSHIFVGARGGFLEPAELSRNPALCALYRHDGTFVFGWREAEQANCLP